MPGKTLDVRVGAYPGAGSASNYRPCALHNQKIAPQPQMPIPCFHCAGAASSRRIRPPAPGIMSATCRLATVDADYNA